MKGIKEIKETHYKSLQLQTTNMTTSIFPIMFLPNSSHTSANRSYDFNLSSKYISHEWCSVYSVYAILLTFAPFVEIFHYKRHTVAFKKQLAKSCY